MVFDPIAFIRKKPDWTAAKKAKYYRSIVRHFSGDNKQYLGSFITMVKSGEVYFFSEKTY